MTDIIQKLTDALGADALVGADRLREQATSYWDSSPTEARCQLRPRSTEELSLAMRICHENGQSVVVQGGRTGVVEGAVSTAEDVIVIAGTHE